MHVNRFKILNKLTSVFQLTHRGSIIYDLSVFFKHWECHRILNQLNVVPLNDWNKSQKNDDSKCFNNSAYTNYHNSFFSTDIILQYFSEKKNCWTYICRRFALISSPHRIAMVENDSILTNFLSHKTICFYVECFAMFPSEYPLLSLFSIHMEQHE